ncbi:hypothetical protein CR513_03740, partial [Mucuna pruriens]
VPVSPDSLLLATGYYPNIGLALTQSTRRSLKHHGTKRKEVNLGLGMKCASALRSASGSGVGMRISFRHGVGLRSRHKSREEAVKNVKAQFKSIQKASISYFIDEEKVDTSTTSKEYATLLQDLPTFHSSDWLITSLKAPSPKDCALLGSETYITYAIIATILGIRGIFTLLDLDKVGYKGKPFIVAFQAKQVFYVHDPSNKGISNLVEENITSSRFMWQPWLEARSVFFIMIRNMLRRSPMMFYIQIIIGENGFHMLVSNGTFKM